MEYINLIKKTFVGCQMTDDDIIMALSSSNFIIKHFDKGEYLHLEEDECHNLEILLMWNIISTQVDEFGTEIIINVLESNQIIAGNILFATIPKYPLSFLAETQGVSLQINKNFLFDLFIRHPIILRQFLILISDRAILLGNKIRLAKRKSLRNYIMEYLHSQSLLQDSNVITLPISKSELANRFGVQRTSVSREFSRMEKEGLIKLFDNKTIELMK